MLTIGPPRDHAAEHAYSQLDNVARLLLETLTRSSALGMRSDTLTPLLDAVPLARGEVASSQLDAFRYRAREAGLPVYGAVAHEDRGLLTLILADNPNGLHIQTVRLPPVPRLTLWRTFLARHRTSPPRKARAPFASDGYSWLANPN
eukprot:1186709-Prorocentrum_minimum.AAC.2